MRYLVTIKPLEEYTLGTEQTFVDKNMMGIGKTSYIATSNTVPDQTTILGALRYNILSYKNLVKTDFSYNSLEREELENQVGCESFSFQKKEKQKFGIIKSISPIFIIKRNEYLIPIPYNLCKDSGGDFHFMSMEETKVTTNFGPLQFPKESEYDPKEGHITGWFNLNSRKIEDNIFFSTFNTGNRKNGDNKEEAFYKRETIRMDTNYCFAVYVDAEQMPESIIGTIGKRKSAFLFEAKGNKENDLIHKVKDAFFQEKSTWYYALSDVVVNKDYELDTFSVIDCKQIRNVSTSYKEKSVRKSNIQYSLIKAGSVFFKKNPIKYENENCSQIGYNHIIKIGGE